MRVNHNQSATVASTIAATAATAAAMSSRRRHATSAAPTAMPAFAGGLTLELQQKQQKSAGNGKLILANPHASNFAIGNLGGAGGAGVGGGGGLGELNVDMGDLTQTPRRRVSSVPASTVFAYRLIRRALGWLTCLVGVSEMALGVADLVIGFSIMSGSDHWSCSTGASVGASILASGITGIVFCISIVFTQYLATGNTVVHSSITGILLVTSLGHTCSALPRFQLSYQAINCTAKAGAYLLLTGFGRLATLVFTGIYYGLLNYYVCRFGEDNTTSTNSFGPSHPNK